jgi:hypothetical protein
VIARSFTDEGVRQFRAWLAAARQDPAREPPRCLLEDDRVTRGLDAPVAVYPVRLATKREAANYLAQALAPLAADQVARDAGLWTWLSLFFFDAVCPPRSGGRRVRNDYYYVFEPQNPRHYYRHLLFVSWNVRRLAGGHDRVFLDTPLSRLDQATEKVMSKLYLTRIPCIFEVIDRLYWDPERQRVRSGVLGPWPGSPGDLRNRLPLRIRQLERTYDLVSLDAGRLLALLGDEFQPRDTVPSS